MTPAPQNLTLEDDFRSLARNFGCDPESKSQARAFVRTFRRLNKAGDCINIIRASMDEARKQPRARRTWAAFRVKARAILRPFIAEKSGLRGKRLERDVASLVADIEAHFKKDLRRQRRAKRRGRR